jgi:hypothetical protein
VILRKSAFADGLAYVGGNEPNTAAPGQRAWLCESASSLESCASAQLPISFGIMSFPDHLAFSSCSVLIGLSRGFDYAVGSA